MTNDDTLIPNTPATPQTAEVLSPAATVAKNQVELPFKQPATSTADAIVAKTLPTPTAVSTPDPLKPPTLPSSGVPTVATTPPSGKVLVPSSTTQAAKVSTPARKVGTVASKVGTAVGKAVGKATTVQAKPKVMYARPVSKSTVVTPVPLNELGTPLMSTGYSLDEADVFHPRFREIEFLATNPESAVEEGQVWVHFNKDKKRELVIVNEVTPKGDVHLTVIFLTRTYSGKRVGANFTASISDFYKSGSNFAPYGSVVGAST